MENESSTEDSVNLEETVNVGPVEAEELEVQESDESPKMTFRNLVFEDLESYKTLLEEFSHGFIGILFKEICQNESGEYFAFGAFEEEKLVGMLIGIRDYGAVRQLTEDENGLAAQTGKKLSHLVAVIVDPLHRRNRIGKRLVEEFNRFTGDETTKFLVIPHENMVAQRFFQSLDFEAVSTLRKYYNEFEDALLFVDKNSFC